MSINPSDCLQGAFRAPLQTEKPVNDLIVHGLKSLLLGIDKHIVYPADSLGEVVLAYADDNIELAGALIYHLYVDTRMSHRSEDTCNSTSCVLHAATYDCEECNAILDLKMIGSNSLAKL